MKESKENPARHTPGGQDIDELLNGFIDGQLTARQQTEVQRLIAHDERIARRLAELTRCKMLVSSLPRAEAPDEMLDKIKAALEKRALLTGPIYDREFLEQGKGAKYLLVRKVLAVAAMVGLVAILAAIVYTIVAPEGVRERPDDQRWTMDDGRVMSPELRTAFTLKLKTTDLSAVNAFINRAIEDNDYCIRQRNQENEGEYRLICSQQGLNLLLADLDSIWDKFDSATLFVDTDQIGEQIVVEQVAVSQIAEIARGDNLKERIKVAKDFARLNNIARLLPGKQLLAALNDRRGDLIPIPKPVLTSGEKARQRGQSPITNYQLPITDMRVELTIVVIGSE